MILNDRMIRAWAELGGITPYDPAMVNPASINLKWSGRYRYPLRKNGIYIYGGDRGALSDFWSEIITNQQSDRLIINPGELLLLDTVEYIRLLPTMAAALYLRSGAGRAGFEHGHAGWFDPAFEGTATLEITNTAPYKIALSPGQSIVQLVIMALDEPERDYKQTGKYSGQAVPTTEGGNR